MKKYYSWNLNNAISEIEKYCPSNWKILSLKFHVLYCYKLFYEGFIISSFLPRNKVACCCLKSCLQAIHQTEIQDGEVSWQFYSALTLCWSFERCCQRTTFSLASLSQQMSLVGRDVQILSVTIVERWLHLAAPWGITLVSFFIGVGVGGPFS